MSFKDLIEELPPLEVQEETITANEGPTLKRWLRDNNLLTILDGLNQQGFTSPVDFTHCREDDIRQISDELKLKVGVKMRFISAVKNIPNAVLGDNEPPGGAPEMKTAPVILIKDEEQTALNNLKKRRDELQAGLTDVDNSITGAIQSYEDTLLKISEQQKLITDALAKRVKELRDTAAQLKKSKIDSLNAQKQEMQEMLKTCREAEKKCYGILREQAEVVGVRDELVKTSKDSVAKTKSPNEFPKFKNIGFVHQDSIIKALPKFGDVCNEGESNVDELVLEEEKKDEEVQEEVAVEEDVPEEARRMFLLGEPLALYEGIAVKANRINRGTNPSAKGKKWDLFMSSKYGGITNTYETLINNDINKTNGAATSSQLNAYIAALFSETHTVSAVTVGGTIWGSTQYINGCELQYLNSDSLSWVKLVDITGVPESRKKFTFGAVVTCALRIWRSNGYVATNFFIME